MFDGLHVGRTLLRRLPTFSPGPATSAQTLTALYDTLTPAPDVREDQEVEDAEVPLDHFSQGMMFYRTGTYFTTLTQAPPLPPPSPSPCPWPAIQQTDIKGNQGHCVQLSLSDVS